MRCGGCSAGPDRRSESGQRSAHPTRGRPGLSCGLPHRSRIWDLRCEPPGLQVGQARAAALPCQRLLAVGTDMAVGKMSACLALLAAARAARCRFVGTGQAGILIGGGIALDAVRVDYAAGAVEAAVLEAAASLADDGLVLVEGRAPCAIPRPRPPCRCCRAARPRIFCWCIAPTRTASSACPRSRFLLCRSWWPARKPWPAWRGPRSDRSVRVRAVALNTAGLTPADARQAVAKGRAGAEPALHGSDPLVRRPTPGCHQTGQKLK